MASLEEKLESALGIKTSTVTPDYTVSDSITAKDADTFEVYDDDGNRRALRLAGASSPEVLQVGFEGQDKGVFKPGEVGGRESHITIAELAREGEFDEARWTGGEGSEGRELGDLVNRDGESLTQKGLYSGALETSRFSSQSQLNTEALGEAERRLMEREGKEDPWANAGDYLGSLRDSVHLQNKPWASNTAQYGNNQDFYQGVETYSGDRYENNEAKNWLGASVELGGEAVLEGWYGTVDLLSDKFQGENTTNFGQQGLDALKDEQSRGPGMDYLNPFDKDTGEWALDSFSDYAKFTIGNLAVSAPAMLNTWVGVVAAPLTGGLSLASPLSVYTGQNYAGQEEGKKNAGVALLAGVGMTVLDAAGLKAIKGVDLLTNPVARKGIVAELATAKGIGIKQADAMLTTLTKREIAKSSKMFKDHLAEQLLAKNVLKNTAHNTARGVVGEGATEMAQEAIGTFAKASGDYKEVDLEELKQTLIVSGITGGILGGGISGISAVGGNLGDIDAVKSHEQSLEQETVNNNRQEEDKAWQISARQGAGTSPRTRVQVIKDLKQEAADNGFTAQEGTLETLAAPEVARQKLLGVAGKAKEYVGQRGIAGLFQGSGKTLADNEVDGNRILSGLTGGLGFHQGNVGETQDQHHESEKAQAMQYVNTGDVDAAQWSQGSPRINEAGINTIMQDQEVRAVILEASHIWSEPGNQSKSLADIYTDGKTNARIPAKYEAYLDNILAKGQELEVFEMHASQKEGKPYKPGSFYDRQPFDKQKIEEESKTVQEILRAQGISGKDAQAVIDEILLNDNVHNENDLSELDEFVEYDASSQETEYAKSQRELRGKVREALNLPELKAYKSDDIFYMQDSVAGSLASQSVSNNFFDARGEDAAAILQLGMKNGDISPEQGARWAKEILDDRQIRAGQYNKISETARKAQNHVMFLSSTAVLPLAAISSLPEVALMNFGLTPEQVYKNIAPSIKAFATELRGWSNDATTKIRLTKRKDLTSENVQKTMNKSIGFDTSSTSARHRQEAAGNRGWQQNTLDFFFKAIFLTQGTNALRMGAAGAGADVMYGWINNIAMDRKQGVQTVLGKESKDAMVELGLDVDRLVRVMDRDKFDEGLASLGRKKGRDDVNADDDSKALENDIRVAMRAFVDGRIAHPTKTNRPKLYYDPRFQIFFGYQGFVSSFTSDILPKIYKNLVRGTPGLKYNALMTVTSLMALGMLGQAVKDELKYGEPSPYLEDWKLFQRTLYSSGLLGTTERALNYASPLYGERSGTNPLDKAWATLSGEAPALSYLSGVGESAASLVSGDTDKGVRQGAKVVPLLGPFTNRRNDLADLAKELFGGN